MIYYMPNRRPLMRCLNVAVRVGEITITIFFHTKDRAWHDHLVESEQSITLDLRHTAPVGVVFIEGKFRPNAIYPFTMERDRKSTRLNSSHVAISYAVFCLKKKNNSSLFG